jgi:hypothetical protein
VVEGRLREPSPRKCLFIYLQRRIHREPEQESEIVFPPRIREPAPRKCLFVYLQRADKYFALSCFQASVAPPAEDGESIHEVLKTMGPNAAIARVANHGVPGSSVLIVSHGEVVEEMTCERERMRDSRPGQERFNNAIWVTEGQTQQKNAIVKRLYCLRSPGRMKCSNRWWASIGRIGAWK